MRENFVLFIQKHTSTYIDMKTGENAQKNIKNNGNINEKVKTILTKNDFGFNMCNIKIVFEHN